MDSSYNRFIFSDITDYFRPKYWIHVKYRLVDGATYNNASLPSYAPQRPLKSGQYDKKFTYLGDDSLTLLINDKIYISSPGDYKGWYKDKQSIVGETNLVLSLDSLQPEHEGIYQFKVKNRRTYRSTNHHTGVLTRQSNTHTSPLALLSSPDTLVVETLILEEYEVLKELYEQTDGSNWTNSWDTLMTGSHKWHGVELTADGRHVKGLRLESNKLNGIIPASLSHLDSLQVLHLQGNQLHTLADLSSLVSLKDFRIGHNYLHFDDIRPNLARFQNDSVRYSPQWIRDGKRHPTFLNDTIQLGSVRVRGTGNTYQWVQHDTLELTGVQQPTLELSPIQHSHAGLYHAEVRHGWCTKPGLAFQTGYRGHQDRC